MANLIAQFYQEGIEGFRGYGEPQQLGPRPSQMPASRDDNLWLQSDIPEFKYPKQWKGVKILGAGYIFP
jgi:hypothetical protein